MGALAGPVEIPQLPALMERLSPNSTVYEGRGRANATCIDAQVNLALEKLTANLMFHHGQSREIAASRAEALRDYLTAHFNGQGDAILSCASSADFQTIMWIRAVLARSQA